MKFYLYTLRRVELTVLIALYKSPLFFIIIMIIIVVVVVVVVVIVVVVVVVIKFCTGLSILTYVSSEYLPSVGRLASQLAAYSRLRLPACSSVRKCQLVSSWTLPSRQRHRVTAGRITHSKSSAPDSNPSQQITSKNFGHSSGHYQVNKTHNRVKTVSNKHLISVFIFHLPGMPRHSPLSSQN